MASSAAVLALAACGGGGHGSSPTQTSEPPPEPIPVQSKLSGVVASGAPFAGAQLKAVDSTGATVCDTTVNADGNYACDLPATTVAPIVVSALRNDQALYSVTASTSGGTVNVTPVTTVIASMLAPTGDPAQLALAIKADPNVAAAAQIQTHVTQVLALLKPLLDALGDATDPITGAFSADGTGYDHVLDAMAVSVRPDGTAANIEITVRTIPSGSDAPPVAVSFRSTDANPPALPPIAPASLPPAGVSVEVTDLMARITACYALPLSQRVNAPSDTQAATGTASDVIAPACRSLFVDDDPATYLNGGARVGRNAAGSGAFSGLFRPGATGAVFDQGTFERYRPNGDLIVTYRTIDAASNVTTDQFVVRDVGGTLKLIGNQYAYAASVLPSVQDREFVNTPAFNYINSGYDLSVPNVLDASGASIFTKVLVTLPDGSVVTLLPTAGNGGLRIPKADGTPSGTSIIRLGAAYRNAATAGNPSQKEPSLFAVPLLSDAQIGALPDQGVWKFEFFFVDGRPNVVQTTRTLVRAYTLAEARQFVFPQLTDGMRSVLVNLSAATGAITFLSDPGGSFVNVITFNDAGGGPAWSVPSLAVAPTQVTAFGAAPTVNGVAGAAFDDNVSVTSTQRSTTIICSKASAADVHCDTSTGQSLYVKGAYFNYLQLTGRNQKQVEIFKGIALYKLD